MNEAQILEFIKILSNSRLISELLEQTTLSSDSNYLVINEGTNDARKIKIPLLRGSLGDYDASTNTPTLSNGVGLSGDTYNVSVSGSRDFGSGVITLNLDDLIYYNGDKWINLSTKDETIKAYRGVLKEGVDLATWTTNNFLSSYSLVYLNEDDSTFNWYDKGQNLWVKLDLSEIEANTLDRHNHTNKTVLDSFGLDNVTLLPTFNGNVIDTVIAQRDVYDGLDSTNNTISLSANRGKELNDNLALKLEAIDIVNLMHKINDNLISGQIKSSYIAPITDVDTRNSPFLVQREVGSVRDRSTRGFRDETSITDNPNGISYATFDATVTLTNSVIEHRSNFQSGGNCFNTTVGDDLEGFVDGIYTFTGNDVNNHIAFHAKAPVISTGSIVQNYYAFKFSGNAVGVNKWVLHSDDSNAKLYVNGDSGLGTSSPLAKLHVNGDAIITSTPTITTATKVLVKDPTTNIISEQVVSYTDLDDLPTIPTNNNQLANGAGYLTDASTQSKYLRSDQNDSSTGSISATTFFVGNTAINSWAYRGRNSLGTSDSGLYFSNNDAELILRDDSDTQTVRLRSGGLDSYINGGDLAIGTTTANAKLHVNGDAIITSTPTITTATKVLVRNPTTNVISEQVITGFTGNTNWQTLTLNSGVTGTVEYKIKNNHLIIKGSFSTSTNGTVTIGTLATGYRPDFLRRKLVRNLTSVDSNLINIYTDGSLEINNDSIIATYSLDIELTLETADS